MLRAPFFVALALVVAFSGGVFSSIAAIEANQTFETVAIGPWVATPLAQTAAANPYAKARRAREGDFPLGQAEGLAFHARTDSAGRPLSGRCAYLLAGNTPASRLWTLHLTDGSEDRIEGKGIFPRAMHSTRLQRRPDGSFTLHLDDTARSGNWIKLDHEGPVVLHLTLFDTPAAGNFGLIDLTMPVIERVECRDA